MKGWKKFMSEGDYQDFLERALTVARTGDESFEKRTNADYCREYAIDKGLMIRFLETSQPKEMAALSKIYKARRDATIFSAFNSACVGKGGSLIRTIKEGLGFPGGHKLALYNPPPNSVNEKTVESKWRENIFSVAREVWVSDTERVDHVIFLNGIAIATIEMKCEPSGQTYKDAIRQYRTERSPETRIFRFKAGALVHFAMDLNEVWMTTRLDGAATTFMPFNRGNGEGVDAGGGNPVVAGHFSTEYMWEEIFTKRTLSEIISRFVFVERKDIKDRKTRKTRIREAVIFPRYHQLDCIRKVLRDVEVNATANNYLIMHSAGSGKTNTIAWLAHRLANLHDAAGGNIIDTVIVVTDRVVVDRQLQKAVLSIDHKGVEICTLNEDKHSDQLYKAIQQNTQIIATTIQKFPYVVDRLKALPERRFAVIIDEAHSSTSGRNMIAVTEGIGSGGRSAKGADEDREEKDAEDVIHELLRGRGKQPNVAMFAFTATPKHHTLKLFGTDDGDGKKRPFHVYSMKQAIEEGFILDVLANYVEYKTFCKIIKLTADDPRYKQRKATGKIKRILALHDVNIAQRCAVIVEHFREYVMGSLNGTAKAMVVTSGREEAVKYRQAIETYIKRQGYSGQISALVAFSGTVKRGGESYTEPGMNGFSEAELPERFDGDDYNVLIVANKYQTGFDQKRLSAMYVLKKMTGVAAVQTLSRLNRSLPGKSTFVLDFVNTCSDMVKAFGRFYTTTILADDVTPGVLYDLVREIEVHSVYRANEVDEFWSLACMRQTDKTRQRIESLFSEGRKRFDNLDAQTRKSLVSNMRKFVKWYDFIVQAAFLDDTALFKKREYIDLLVRHLDIGGGGDGFSLKDKVDAIDFVQKKMAETLSPKIDPKPESFVPEPTANIEEDGEERLSKIIERLNSMFGTNLNPGIATKCVQQIKVKLESDKTLEKAAKANTLDAFKLPFFGAAEDAMTDCLEQNEEFYSLLLKNKDAAETILGAILKNVYTSLRGKR